MSGKSFNWTLILETSLPPDAVMMRIASQLLPYEKIRFLKANSAYDGRFHGCINGKRFRLSREVADYIHPDSFDPYKYIGKVTPTDFGSRIKVQPKYGWTQPVGLVLVALFISYVIYYCWPWLWAMPDHEILYGILCFPVICILFVISLRPNFELVRQFLLDALDTK